MSYKCSWKGLKDYLWENIIFMHLGLAQIWEKEKKICKMRFLQLHACRKHAYESEPVGCEIEQGNYLNSAILIASEFTPHEMLGICMGIECALGRERTVKNAPRIIDIDMLYAEDKVLKTKNLVVPHPEIENRLFVLAPLKDIFFMGNAFGFIFDQYIDKNRNQRLKLTNFKLTYPRYEGK